MTPPDPAPNPWTLGTASGQEPMRLSLWERSEKSGVKPTEVALDSPLRRAVTSAILVALDFLGRPQSRAVLARMGLDALKHWKVYRSTDDVELPHRVDTFLRSLRRQFVKVELTKRHPHSGVFLPPTRTDSVIQRGWEPLLGGTILLNHFMVESMAMADQGARVMADYQDACEEAYGRFLFLLAIVLAHELVHCYMCSISRDETRDSPTELAGFRLWKRGPGDGWGDSGYIWELHMLGGKIVAIKEPNHRLGVRQAGRLWIQGPQSAWPMQPDSFRVCKAFDIESSSITRVMMLPESLNQTPINPVTFETLRQERSMEQMRVATMRAKGIPFEDEEPNFRPSPRPRYKVEEVVPALAASAPGSTESPTTTPSSPMRARLAAEHEALKPTSSPARRTPAEAKWPAARNTGEQGMNSPSSAAPRTSTPKPSTPLKSTAAPVKPGRNNSMNSPSSSAPSQSAPSASRPSGPLKSKAAPANVAARTDPAKTSPESSASRAGNGTGQNTPAEPGASTGTRPTLQLAIPH